jgi:hypothetical protein
MAANLRRLLAASEHLLVEQAISVLCADNLGVACAVVEKTTLDQAIRKIEDALVPSFAFRRKYAEQRVRSANRPFVDVAHQSPASFLPDALRPKAGKSPTFVLLFSFHKNNIRNMYIILT